MRKFILFSLSSLLLASLSTGQRIQTVEIGNSRYFVSNVSPYSPTLNWFLAYQYCRNIGMELLSLEQIEETSEITKFLTENNYITTEYWTGGNQLGSPMWIWMSTGQPLNSTFNYWAAGGPPLTKSDQSCMSTQNSVWAPQNCMDSKAFLCEQTRCFFYNYVTTNRASTQGNSTILPGLIRVANRTQPIVKVMQPVKNLTDHEESLQNPIRTMTISIDESRILDQLDTSTDIVINEEKIFSTVDTLGDEVSLPTEFPQLKEMSSTVLEESLVDTQKNEIVPTEQNLLLSLLQPPVHEFTFEVAKASEGEDDRSAMAILRRKETFSWALTDAGTE